MVSILSFMEPFQLLELDIMIFGETCYIANIVISLFLVFTHNVIIIHTTKIVECINFDILFCLYQTVTNISFRLEIMNFIVTFYRSPSINDDILLMNIELILAIWRVMIYDIFLGDMN